VARACRVANRSLGAIAGRRVRDDQPADGGLGEDVKDGVGVSFALHGDDTNLVDTADSTGGVLKGAVAGRLGSLSGEAARVDGGVDRGEDPDDGVADPGEEGKTDNVAKESSNWASIGAAAASRASGNIRSDLGEEVHDGEEGKHGETEESPLFVASDEFTDEAGDDHEDVHKHEEDLHEFVTTVFFFSEVDEFPENEGGSDGPVNVASVVEITAVALGDVTITKGHRDISEGSNHADDASTHANGIPAVMFFNVFVATVHEVKGRKEEKAKGNPKDGPVVDFVVAGVDRAAGARG